MRLGRNMGCGLSRFGLARKRTHPTDENSRTSLKLSGDDGGDYGGRGDRKRRSRSKGSSRHSSTKADNTKAQKAWKNAVEPQMANEGGDANEPSGRSPFWRIGSVRKPFTADAYRQGGSSEPVGEVLQQTEQQMFIHKLKLIQAQKAKDTEGSECFMQTNDSPVPTQSQIEFFRTLDEKIAQGRDYSYSPSWCS